MIRKKKKTETPEKTDAVSEREKELYTQTTMSDGLAKARDIIKNERFPVKQLFPASSTQTSSVSIPRSSQSLAATSHTHSWNPHTHRHILTSLVQS